MTGERARREASDAGAGDAVRCFLAVDLEPAVLDGVHRLQAELVTCGADVRWVRPAGMHVTLKFLGEVAPVRVAAVSRAVAQAVGGRPPVPVRVRGLGAFPSLRRPRVLWVGIESAGLVPLAAAVEAAVVPLGFASEGRPFSPHLTLGRVASLRGWPRLEAVLKGHLGDDFGACTVEVVTLYRSTLQRGGAVYSPLERIMLYDGKEGAAHDNGCE